MRPKSDPDASPAKSANVSWIAPDLRALAVPVSELRPDPKNARAHSPRNIAAIRSSLSRFGQARPIVALEDGTVIAGNGTLTAAKELGHTHLAVTRFANEDQARAFALADNRTAELAEWDWAELAGQLEDLNLAGEDLTELGWETYEVEAIAHGDGPVSLSDIFGGKGKGDDEGQSSALPGDPSSRIPSVRFSEDQWEVIEAAVARARTQADDPGMPPSRALELIAADYLAGGRA